MNTKPLLFVLFLIGFYACQQPTNTTCFEPVVPEEENDRALLQDIVVCPDTAFLNSLSADSLERNERRARIVQGLDTLQTGDKLPHSFMLEAVSCMYGNFELQTDFQLAQGELVDWHYFYNPKILRARLETPIEPSIWNDNFAVHPIPAPKYWKDTLGIVWYLDSAISSNEILIYKNSCDHYYYFNMQILNTDNDALFEIALGHWIFEQEDTMWRAVCLSYPADIVDAKEDPYLHMRAAQEHGKGIISVLNIWCDCELGEGCDSEDVWFRYIGDSLMYLGQFNESIYIENSWDESSDTYIHKEASEEFCFEDLMQTKYKSIRDFHTIRNECNVVLHLAHPDTLLHWYISENVAEFSLRDSQKRADKDSLVSLYGIPLKKMKDKAIIELSERRGEILINRDTIQATFVLDKKTKQYKYHSTKSLSLFFTDAEVKNIGKNHKEAEGVIWNLDYWALREHYPHILKRIEQHGTKAQRLILPWIKKLYKR